MAFLKIQNVKISGISAAVPKNVVVNSEYAKKLRIHYDVNEFIETTGVKERRIDKKIQTYDLCLAAAENLIKTLEWEKEDIDGLIFVSQTGEFLLPATSCILQNNLELSKNCFAEDIGLGCSGWVYGLSTISSLIQSGNLKKCLLLVGDTNIFEADDDLLFGSAGTATALEFDSDATPMYFNMGTDGSGYDAIIIPGGMARNPFSEKSLLTHIEEGHEYNDLQVHMRGMDVFSFGITKVPKAIKQLAEHYNFQIPATDYLILHQANKKMNDMIVKKLNYNKENAPLCLQDFGNTSSASIPLTLVTQLRNQLQNKQLKLLCCGFGVGLSWGACLLETNKIKIPDLIEL